MTMSSDSDVDSKDMRTSIDTRNSPAMVNDEKHHVDVPSLKGETAVTYKAQFPNVDEKKIIRKIDLRVVPYICILYLCAFLDRVNISNAALFGLRQDLKLHGNQYNTVLLIFFVPYIVFEIPSNILLKRFKPHVWLSFCMFGFGFVTIMQGLTQNFSGILTTRFFLGLFESGMFPGCLYLISMWYRRSEAQTRYTFFFSSNSLAGSFAGLLGYGIGQMDGARGYRGWRWVFILEGVLTCVLAIALYFLISDFPEEADWLTQEEKEFVKARLKDDVGRSGRDEKMTMRAIIDGFKEYKNYLGGLMYLGLIVPAYSFAYFAPGIIQSYGHTAVQTQLLSVPPYFCAFVFGMIVSAISDRLQHRFAFNMFAVAISLTGFIILCVVHNHTNLQYAALFLAATGTFTAMPLVICWFGMNVRGHVQRAVATGFQIGFGNVGGIIAAYGFLAKDAPKYIPGYSLCIGFVCLSTVASCLYLTGVVTENKRRKNLTLTQGSRESTEFVYIV